MSWYTKFVVALRKFRYMGSAAYWEQRYATGGHSGTGSSGILAQYKALIVNDIVWKNEIETVVEFGCGDGQQLALADYPDYLGLDISPAAVARCREMFADEPSKRFALYKPFQYNPTDFQADLSLSMEVIFHLTEQDIYERYLTHLFAAAKNLVVIFSSNEPDHTGGIYPHFMPRMFANDVPRLAPGWKLREKIENPHRSISRSDFYVYERDVRGCLISSVGTASL